MKSSVTLVKDELPLVDLFTKREIEFDYTQDELKTFATLMNNPDINYPFDHQLASLERP